MEYSDCKICLNSSKCFKKLLSDELNFVDSKKAQIIYHKGETLCKKGSLASTIYYVIDGLIKMYIDGPGKKNIGVTILQSGDFIGLSTLHGSSVYPYSASALCDTKVCVIDKGAITELINQNCDFGSEIVKWYCHSYGKLFRNIERLGFKHLNGRVAEILLELDTIKYSEKNIHNYLTRKDLADLAGIPTGSLMRILSEFSEEGLIEINRKNIKIKNPRKLANISQIG